MADHVVGEVELRHIAGFFAVTLTTRGGYGDRAAPFERLLSWVDGVGVYQCGSPMSVFFGTPAADAADPIRYSLCIPVSKPDAAVARAALATGARAGSGGPGAALGEGDVVEVREFPRILAAAAFYRGEVAGASAAYARVGAWVREHPYLPTGAPREVFVAQPGVLPVGLLEVEVHQPVIPRPR